MRYLIGLDVGTTGAKAVLVDEKGTVVRSATKEYPMSTPKPLWAEQDPEDWWKAASGAFREVASGVGQDAILGVGLTGQMHGLVALDSSDRVLRPCIMWNDQRTADECSAITEKVTPERLIELTANPVLPGFTAPKILWMRNHEPALYGRIAKALLPKDFIRYRLTGDFATDVSDASGTSLFDVRHRRWSLEMLGMLGIPAEWMPRSYESVEVTGRVTEGAARATGLAKGLPVVAGAGDQAAGGVGSGIVEQGVVSVTIGTSGVVFAHADSLAADGRLHAFCHAVPGAWHVMGVTLAAGGSLRWYRDVLGAEEHSRAAELRKDAYEILMEEAALAPAGSEGLFFLPYLSGERTPYADHAARGAFVGLTLRHTKSHLVRSVLEGVAYSMKDCLELVHAMGISVREVRISGGGARGMLWRRIIAGVLDANLVTVTSTEGAPFGAALLAGVGAGVFENVRHACSETVRVSSVTAVDPHDRSVYASGYGVYRSLYPSLKGAYSAIGSL